MAALTTAAALAATGYSLYQGYQQTRTAEKQMKKQKKQIAEEEAAATEERKGLLSTQRYQMGLDNTYSTSSLADDSEDTLG